MPDLFNIKWNELFPFTISPIEIIIRGVVTYLALILLLRFVLKREGGQLAFTDILTIVLLGDASQNAMASDHKSIADGILLVITILGCNYLLDYLQFHFDAIDRLLSPPPLPLVRNGRLLRRNMRHEMVRLDDIMTEARAVGIENLSDIKLANMEGDGRITIIPKRGAHQPPDERSAVH
jgi:uncharacterized membrane protein YcaP (DUF421 family)